MEENKVSVYRSKRKAVFMSGSRLWIGSQSVTMSNISSSDPSAYNSAGNKRGMNKASKGNLEAGAKPGFGIFSRRNLSKCIDIFYWSCKRSRGLNPITKKMGFLAASFITLTIPDMHTVIDSKKGYEKLIKGYIKWMAETFGVQSYVWKFEWQNRGQGHWHMFVDRFCSQSEMRKEWIRRLDAQGLVSDWKKKHDYDPRYCCKIKGLRNEKELREYLAKYMSKSSQNEEVTEGRAWGASMWIKKAKKMVLPVTDRFMRNVEEACSDESVIKIEVKIPALDMSGVQEKNQDGSDKEILIGTSIIGKKVRVEDLLCNRQRIWYDEYIKAYQARDWERTHDLSFDMDKIVKDGVEYRQTKEYIEHCRVMQVGKMICKNSQKIAEIRKLAIQKKNKLKAMWSSQVALFDSGFKANRLELG